jgi:hypothetical protein
MDGIYYQDKAKIRIEWDTATGCWSKECDISDRIPGKCPRAKDSAIINHDGRISFRNYLYTRSQ